jgi:2-dehydro-3-deoxygluconokinase
MSPVEIRDRRPDVLAIGEPLVEFNQTRPGEPVYLQGFGGDSSNAMIAAARSGARAAYVTRVGDDEFGRMFRALWEAESVDARGVATDPEAHTAVYFVTHGRDGHVFSYLRAGSAASRLRPEDLPLDLVRAARFVHASGISTAISPGACETVLAAFDAARAAGAKVSFDSNLRLKLWPLARARATIAATAALADYFFPSLEDARALSGLEDPEAILDWAHRLGAKHVFLKLGADGVIASDGARRDRIAGHRVQAVDATGAGDCFCGAALARLAAGDALVDAARYANAAAALATTGFGAVAPLPRAAAVREFLANERTESS